MLDLQPTLAGTLITLRPLMAADFDELFAAASDPLVWAQHPDPRRATPDGFPPYFTDALQSKGCLVAIDATRGSLVGWSRYTQYQPGTRLAIGYTFLARSHWGGATNAEMKRLMLRHAFPLTPRLWARDAAPGYGPEPHSRPNASSTLPV
jgi:RimJ/RimL family protein N-acetyltransferase